MAFQTRLPGCKLRHRLFLLRLLRSSDVIMLRLPPTTIALMPSELRWLEHRPRRKGLLERMSNIQIHEDSPREDNVAADTSDNGRGLRDEDSTRGPLRVPSPNSERLNQRLDPRAPEYIEAGPSGLSSGEDLPMPSLCYLMLAG